MSDSILLGKYEATIKFENGDTVTIKKPGLQDHFDALAFINETMEIWDPIRVGIENARAGEKVDFQTSDVKKMLQSGIARLDAFKKLIAKLTGNQVDENRFQGRGEKALTIEDLANVIKALWDLAELGKFVTKLRGILPGQGESERSPLKKRGSKSATFSEANTEPLPASS